MRTTFACATLPIAVLLALLIAGCAATTPVDTGVDKADTASTGSARTAEPVFEVRPPVDGSTLPPEVNVQRERLELAIRVKASEGEQHYRSKRFRAAIRSFEACLDDIRFADDSRIPLNIGDTQGRVAHMLERARLDKVEYDRQREIAVRKRAESQAGR